MSISYIIRLQLKHIFVDKSIIASYILKLIVCSSVSLFLAFIGLNLSLILDQIPEIDKIQFAINAFIFALFLDYIIKLLTVSPSIGDIYAYLALPINRRWLFYISYIKCILLPQNFFILIFLGCFLIKLWINGVMNISSVIGYILLTGALSILNTIYVRYIKSQQGLRRFTMICCSIIMLTIVVFMCNRYNIKETIDLQSQYNIAAYILFPIIVIFSFIIHLKQCYYELYNNVEGKRTLLGCTIDLRFLNCYYMLLIKMITRSNLKYSLFLLPLVFCIQAVTLCDNKYLSNLIISICSLIAITPSIIISSLSLHSKYIDLLICSDKGFIRSIIATWFGLCAYISLLNTIILSIFVSKEICTISYVITISICMPIIAYSTVYAKSRIDPMLNSFQVPKSQLGETIFIAIAIAPILLVNFVCELLDNKNIIFVFLISVSCISVSMLPIQIKLIKREFMKRRYENLAGMRQ